MNLVACSCMGDVKLIKMKTLVLRETRDTKKYYMLVEYEAEFFQS